MGGVNFETYSFGKNAKDAFSEARARALWEHGHGGYTGTIAEKRGYVEFDVKELGISLVRFDKMIDAAVYDDVDNFNRLSKGMIPAAVAKVKKASEVWDDKWGNALCVKITGKFAKQFRAQRGLKGKKGNVYRFSGIASS